MSRSPRRSTALSAKNRTSLHKTSDKSYQAVVISDGSEDAHDPRPGGAVAMCYSRPPAMENDVSTHPKTKITPQEYLELERKAETKSEYLDGEIFAMAGVSRDHVRIVVNIITELN